MSGVWPNTHHTPGWSPLNPQPRWQDGGPRGGGTPRRSRSRSMSSEPARRREYYYDRGEHRDGRRRGGGRRRSRSCSRSRSQSHDSWATQSRERSGSSDSRRIRGWSQETSEWGSESSFRSSRTRTRSRSRSASVEVQVRGDGAIKKKSQQPGKSAPSEVFVVTLAQHVQALSLKSGKEDDVVIATPAKTGGAKPGSKSGRRKARSARKERSRGATALRGQAPMFLDETMNQLSNMGVVTEDKAQQEHCRKVLAECGNDVQKAALQLADAAPGQPPFELDILIDGQPLEKRRAAAEFSLGDARVWDYALIPQGQEEAAFSVRVKNNTAAQ